MSAKQFNRSFPIRKTTDLSDLASFTSHPYPYPIIVDRYLIKHSHCYSLK